MKKAFEQPFLKINQVVRHNIISTSLSVGDDYTGGDYEGRSRGHIWDDDDDWD